MGGVRRGGTGWSRRLEIIYQMLVRGPSGFGHLPVAVADAGA
ncbi:MAG: hypothetical protein ACRDUA_25455 [Micromonosporaceae bacterium]